MSDVSTVATSGIESLLQYGAVGVFAIVAMIAVGYVYKDGKKSSKEDRESYMNSLDKVVEAQKETTKELSTAIEKQADATTETTKMLYQIQGMIQNK